MLKQRLAFVSVIMISLTNLLSGQALMGVRRAEKESNFSVAQHQPFLNLTQQASATKTSPQLTTVDQILDKYVQAIGGVTVIQTITSRVMKGTITAPTYKISGTVEIYAKAPNKQLTEIKAPILGVTRTGFDGAVAWEEENGAVKDAPAFSRRDADFYLPIKLKELYPRIELKGTEKIANAEAYRLEAPRNGNPRRWYFATDTGLLIRTEVRDATGKLLSSEDYEDYRAVDGIKIPFTIHQFEDGLETITQLTEVKHNIAIDDLTFTKPSAAKPVTTLSAAEQKAAAQLKAETIREVTTTLAAKEMEGRGTAQAGGDKAAQYLADRFARLGLKPGGDQLTFLQRINFLVDTPLPETTFKVAGTAFKFKTDFTLLHPMPSASTDVGGRMVFAGYGVVSDELKRDDLAGLDIKGNIVVLLEGRPSKVDAAAWDRAIANDAVYGRLLGKGALGFVLVYREMRATAPFSWIARILSRRGVNLAETPRSIISAAPVVLVGGTVAEKILGERDRTFVELKQVAATGKFVSRNLDVSASISVRIRHEERSGSNVIGVLEGSDARLKNEAVIYSAHYDAFGIDTDGTIYPGAADNALGVGKLVALAEVFTRLTPKPRRSMVFVSWTGEEYGDLGSEYWLQHPTWPLERVAANINYDGIGTDVWGKLAFLLDLGFDDSDLGAAIRKVAAASDVEVVPDTSDEEVFYRSDHYSFILRGIPAIFLLGGPADDPAKLEERVKNTVSMDYHQSTDTVRSDWDWEGARMLAALGLITGMRVANQEAMPVWKANSPWNHPRGWRR